MSRLPEVTEAQLLERERMRTLQSDEDLIAATMRFDHWVKSQNLNYNDAVSQMLHFLRENLLAKRPLRDALLERMDPLLDEMVTAAKRTDPKLSYATEILVHTFRHEPDAFNYEPKPLYFGELVGSAEFIFPESKDRNTVIATHNSVFDQAISAKIRYARKTGARKPLKDEQISRGRELFEVAVLKSYFNISYHNDNIGGRNSWQEGEEIALGIYRFIQSPASRGLLCSLLPPDGPTEVDWSRNEWVNTRLHRDWLNYKEPEDLLRHFDAIAALS